MQEARDRLMALMGEMGVSQADLIRYINGSPSIPYNVTPAEMSNAVRGTSLSPKMGRIVSDSVMHLEKLKNRMVRDGKRNG